MLCLVSGTILGATVGTRITAQLLQMKIVKDNEQVLKDTKVISYDGATYVPLRAFGDITGVKIDYKDGVIYLGDNNVTGETANTSDKVEKKPKEGSM